MTLNAIFDESGTHGPSDLVVFGGFIGHQPECATLSEKWNRAIERADPNLPFLHMAELNQRYLRSTDDKEKKVLVDLVEDLAKIICEHMTGGALSAITIRDFMALPKEQRRRHKRAFHYAFEDGILGLVKFVDSSGDDLALICDDSDDASKCLEAFKRLKAINPAVSLRLPFISFGDDKRYPPLQAADMFAFCYRSEKINAAPGLWRKPLDIIMATFSHATERDIRLDGDEIVS